MEHRHHDPRAVTGLPSLRSFESIGGRDACELEEEAAAEEDAAFAAADDADASGALTGPSVSFAATGVCEEDDFPPRGAETGAEDEAEAAADVAAGAYADAAAFVLGAAVAVCLGGGECAMAAAALIAACRT